MGVLSEIIQYKQMERQKDMADINAIGTSVSNFIKLKQQQQNQALNRRLIEAKIKSLEPSMLDQLLQKGQAVEAAQNLIDAHDPSGKPLLDQLIGRRINNNLDPAAKVSVDAADSVSQKVTVDSMQKPQLAQFGVPRYDRTPSGRELSPEGETQKKLTETKMTQDIKDKAAMGEGKRMALQNIDLVSGAIRELSQTYADAYNEGGIGSRGKSIKSGIDRWLGGERGDKFPATAAFEGQKTEVVSRLMPLLTQQGDKPGSVRLVSTVFSKLEKTLPGENTPPKSAKRMMEQTLRNMYRFARASQRLGLTNEAVEGVNKADLKIMSEKVAQVAKSIEISGEEEKQLNDLLSQSLSPIDNIINKKLGKTSSGIKYKVVE